MICEDTYRECLASVAPRENAARIARDGQPGYRTHNQGSGEWHEATWRMMQHMTEPRSTVELAELASITPHSVGNRMAGLIKRGLAVSCGEHRHWKNGRVHVCNIWKLTEEGMGVINAD